MRLQAHTHPAGLLTLFPHFAAPWSIRCVLVCSQFAHGQGELQPRPLKAAEKAALAAAAVAAAAGQVAGSPSLENGLGSGSIGDGGTMPTVSTSTSTAAIATASADDAGAAKEGRLWEGSPAAVAPDAGAGTAAVDQTHEEL